MLEINRLQSEGGIDNQNRIQDLQRRVTDLSDLDTSNNGGGVGSRPGIEILEPPPAYVRDGS